MSCSESANVLSGVALICGPRRNRPSGRIISQSTRATTGCRSGPSEQRRRVTASNRPRRFRSSDERPLSARLTRWRSSRRRSLVPTDSGRSALDAGTRLSAHKRPSRSAWDWLSWVESRCGAVAVGRAYLLLPLSSGGASLARPWLRFHTRSSNRTGRFPASGSRTRLHAFF